MSTTTAHQQAVPSTPTSSGKSSNLFGKVLSKLRTPTGGGDGYKGSQTTSATPRSSSPAFGRRSSSKSSMRLFGGSNHGTTRGGGAPSSPSINSSTSSLALPASNSNSFDFDDDSLDYPQFESDIAKSLAARPSPSARNTPPYSKNLPSTSSLLSLSSLGGDQPHPSAPVDTRHPLRPNTSTSTRSRAGSVNGSTATGSAGSGLKNALFGKSIGLSGAQNSTERASGSMGRSWSKSIEPAQDLGRSMEGSTSAGPNDARGGQAIHSHASQSPEESKPASLSASSSTRAPTLTRQTSTDRTATAPRVPAADDGVTPGFPRSGLSRSTAPSTLASSSTATSAASVGRKNWLNNRPTGTVHGKARRVVRPPEPMPSEPSADSQEEHQDQSASQDRRVSVDHSSSAEPSPASRPSSSPNGHGRSRSELPPSSPKLQQSSERAAATLTLTSSSYLRRHGLDGNRPGSSLDHHSQEVVSEQVRLPSSNSAATAAASATFSQMRANQPNSTIFRERHLRGGSSAALSASSSSNNNSPDPPSFTSTASDPSPPLRSSVSASSASSQSSQPSAQTFASQPRSVSASGPIKLDPMGPGLARKNSVSLLSSLDDRGDSANPVTNAHRLESSTRAAAQLAQVRASIEGSRAAGAEEIVPYAARASSSREGGGHRYDQPQQQDTVTAYSSTLVGSTTSSLKRSNSETLMASTSSAASSTLVPTHQPVPRPGSRMGLYRDDPQQSVVPSRRPSNNSHYPSPPLAPPSHTNQGHAPPPVPAVAHLQPYHDENVYDARHQPSALQPHEASSQPPPPNSRQYPPSSLPPPHQQQTASSLPNGRQVLGEVNRGYPPATVTQQQRGYVGGKSQDFQVPLRDRSPGIAEATPSYTAQQHHYQSQQAYQHQQQHQQQQGGGGMMHPMQPPMSEQAHSEPIKRLPKHIMVNGKAYHRAGILGRGGSSKVYRVIAAQNNDICALKKVDCRNDAESRASFINEITLLKKLSGKQEIIQLIDSEVQSRYVYMVMEAGDTDLNSLLATYSGLELSLNRVRYIWEQMLCAVQVIHNESIVHSDLKPANFVIVKGRVKLIDFGISKAIAADTTNIGRDQQIGTANYMPPEALLDTGLGDDGKRLMKLGRPADVWELGCILYQLVYGQQPFAHIRDLSSKILQIQNPLHRINYPPYSVPKNNRGEELKHLSTKVGPDLLQTMQSCLKYYPKERATIPELLQQPFLRRSGDEVPSTTTPASVPPGATTVNESEMAILTQRIAFMLGGQHAMEKLMKNPNENADLAKKLMGELRALKSS